MINLDKAIDISLRLVQSKAKHRHYDHVTELARKYYRPMATGVDIGPLVHQFSRRETKEEYEQRLRLTQVITPAIINTIMTPVRKIPKVKPVVNTATFGVDKKEDDQKLREAVNNFWNGKSVDHFFSSVLLDQGAIDPNAFCLVLYDGYDDRFDKPVVHPSVISAEDAWNFEYFNGVLQWLWVHRTIQYDKKEGPKKAEPGKRVRTGKTDKEPKKVDGHAFWLYTDQHQVYFSQVDASTIGGDTVGVLVDKGGRAFTGTPAMEKKGEYYYRPSRTELYEVSFYEHGLGMVQAFRIGYIPDQRTGGDTLVSIWNPAMPFLMKGIKAGSELDLSAALHAFLQKIQYSRPCSGTTDGDGRELMCDNGRDPSGKICSRCGGSGFEVHTSGQDHVTLRMPRTKDDFLELSNLVHYVQLPVEVLTWQDGYVDKLEKAAYRAVYNSDRFRADSSNVTATGEIIDLQSVYDAIKPGADWYSQARVLVYKLVASFTFPDGADKLVVAHEFPRNMRYETLSERVNLMKALREAGSSTAALLQVDATILEDLYVDDPEAERKAKVRASFDPFIGKTENAILQLISQDLATKEQKVFWTNMSLIFSRAEAEQAKKGVDFYDLPREKQQDLLDKVTADLLDTIEGEKEEAMLKLPMGGAGDGTGEGEGPGGKPGDGLPPSPGNSATE